ncbi:acetyl-CoA hydrolase/transferase family protein [Francisella sp. SYW-9]|uniref:acetyl-CoA hydrolase/transferase family protein n=1 Tax=Francisella sp. SYW-9 TaxID=2610888 RepID=UPI00123CB766|nr:acetyl-CoA hydrolase/transferase C-terminal domain-containing protein [Francisella sp. SYW-9]
MKSRFCAETQELYNSKKTTPEKAVELIHSGSKVGIGLGISAPIGLVSEMVKKVKNKDLENIDLYYLRSTPEHLEKAIDYEALDEIKVHCFFLNSLERSWIKKGLEENKRVLKYIPCHLSKIPRVYEEANFDVFSTTVSEIDEHGYFSCGTNNDANISGIKSAKKVIVEVNKYMPRVFGESQIHISEVDAIIERHEPLTPANRQSNYDEIDEKIVAHIAEHIEDGACLQIGMGNLPDLLCQKLKDRKHLGIHSELFSMGMADLIKCGAVDGSRKTINKNRHVFTIAYGDQDFYEFMHNNPSLEGYPSNYTNDPHIIGLNDNVISVNSILEIDLFGQINAEKIYQSQYSGIGGQTDFILGAQRSKGGKSFIATRSTAKNDTISKIVPQLCGNVVSDTRMDVQYVVTEYGCVNLFGLSTEDRMKELIKIAHPKFRAELEEKSKQLLFHK